MILIKAKIFLFALAEYAIISVRLSRERLATPFLKGGGMMTIFEAMYLMIAFATLVVLIIKQK